MLMQGMIDHTYVPETEYFSPLTETKYSAAFKISLNQRHYDNKYEMKTKGLWVGWS